MSVSEAIGDGDAMYGGDRRHYAAVGRSALRCIDAALSLTGRRRDDVHRVLDLACGHGRVMRVLRSAFPDSTIVGCDVDEDGLRFCSATFDAVPVVSAADPSTTVLDEAFDLLWCGSLLTHLPRPVFERTLRWCVDHVGGGGIAVVTTHGRRVAERIGASIDDYGLGHDVAAGVVSEARRTGFGYADYPGAAGYGISLSQPAWLLDLVDGFASTRVVLLGEAAWDEHQDVLVLTPWR